MRGLVAIVVVAAGCGEDPSLTVEVAHPDASGVDHTTITVYESETATCTDVEFSLLDEAQLTALEVAVLQIDAAGKPMSGALAGISRDGKKLVVARGFTAENALVTAGCSEHFEIVEGDRVLVETFLVAEVSIGALGGSDAAVEITLTAANGTAITQRRVGWRVFGPQGTEPAIQTNIADVEGLPSTWEPADPACTDGDGQVRLRPVPPKQLGGFAFDVRASWGAEPPQLFSSFTRFGMGLRAFAPPDPTNRRWCAIRSAGATDKNLVCIEDRGGANNIVAVMHAIDVSDGAAVFGATPQTQTTPAGTVALVGADRGNTVRDVYAVGAKGAVTSVFTPSVPITIAPFLGTDETVSDALAVPSCSSGESPKLVLVIAPAVGVRRVRVFDLTTRQDLGDVGVPPAAQLDINNAGCVTELDPDLQAEPVVRQVVVIDSGRFTSSATSAHFACDAPPRDTCSVPMPVGRAGTGFIDNGEPRIVAPFFDASGVVLIESVMLPDANGRRRLVQRERMAAAAFPQRVAVGLLDEGTDADLVWTIINAEQQATNVQVAYGRLIGDARLTALSGQQDLIANDLQVADVTRDGTADIIVTGRNEAGALGVAVIPSHVELPPGNVTAETACGAP